MKQTLEEAAKEYWDKWLEENPSANHTRIVSLGLAFIAGAEWQSKQSPWISVKERLPEELESVLVLSNYEGKYLYEVAFIMNGIWICHNNKPAYWTPIPSFDEILEANKDVLERIKQKGD